MVMLLSRIFDFIGLKKDYCLVFFQVVLQSLIFTNCVLISMDSWWSLGSVSLRIRAVL